MEKADCLYKHTKMNLAEMICYLYKHTKKICCLYKHNEMQLAYINILRYNLFI